jgi:hypothetical protein
VTVHAFFAKKVTFSKKSFTMTKIMLACKNSKDYFASMKKTYKEVFMDKQSIQSMGGAARAKALTEEERKEIASNAAASRWNIPKATHEGVIEIGKARIPCAVLENGTRVLTQGGFLRALGRARTAKGRAYYDSDVNMPVFLTAKNLKPFITNELQVASSQMIFKPLKGARAFGFPAELLPKVCEVFLKARDAGVITLGQKHIAEKADILIRGLARVGITALVDEATGFQEIRDRLALQKILEKYLTDEWAKWTKTFPNDFYRQLFRLKGLSYPPPLSGKKPSYVGHWTNDIIYKRLAPGVLKALKEKTPRLASGTRVRKFHQSLTRDYGHPALKELLTNVIFLMKGCTSWGDFKRKLDRAAQKYGDTIPMGLNDEPKE